MAALDERTNHNTTTSSSSSSDIYDFDNELQYEHEFKPEQYSSHKQKAGLRAHTMDQDEGLDEEEDDDRKDEELKLSDLHFLEGKTAEQSGESSYSGSAAAREEDDEDEDDEEDSSSGFGSGGVGMSSYDNLSGVSYGTIGGEENAGGQVDVGALGSLIMEPGHGLMLEDDDFGDNVEDDDDMDTPVERLLRRAGCVNSKARENVCLSIRTTLHQVMDCPDDVRALMALFRKLAADQSQSVRIELVEQIPQLAVLCHEFPHHLAAVMDDHLLPLTLHYVTNPVAQLRKTTQAALLVMLEQRLLEEPQVRHVCYEVAQLTMSPQQQGTDLREARSEDDRADALALISRMAPILGRPLTEEFFLVRLADLCADTSSHIRKICAGNFGEFTAVCGTNITEAVLLPLFVSLCKDSVWEVRKACSESFMAVSAACLLATRYSSLSPIFVNLMDDHSRWVRVSAFQHLGMFISTFAPPEALTRRPDTYEQQQAASCEAMAPAEGDRPTFSSQEASEGDGSSTGEQQPSSSVAALELSLSPHTRTPTTLGFLTDTRPHSSPLPAVNLLEQPYTTGDQQDYESYNNFNYWRMPLPHIDLDDLLLVVEPPTSSDDTRGEASSDESVEEREAVRGSGEKQMENSAATAGDGREEDAEVLLVQESMSRLSVEEPEPRPVSPRRRRRQQEDEAESCITSPSNSAGLERASEPVAFSEVLAQGVASSDGTSVGDDLTDDPLNTSNDSSDSDDTIIEMSTFNQGLLSVDDEANTSEAFKEDVRRRGDDDNPPAAEAKNNIWLMADLAAASIDSATAEELYIADKVRQQSVVPQNLLEQFLLMTDPRRAETVEKEITRHCAFAMPAVALTLGRNNWHVMRDTYKLLSSNYQWRVRRTLAYSMHEMAAILGGEHATADILPLYQDFTANEPECVRVGLLENLAQFVRVMPPSVRREMLPNMATFYGANDRRQRQEFGNQLAQLLKLYPPADVDQHLKDFCITLLTDNVVYNRQYVHGLISLLVERLGCEGDTCYVVGVCQALTHDFAHNPKWSRRQTFVFVAGRVFADGVMDVEVYCDHLLPALLSLAQDRVPNVRLAVAEVMTNHIVGHDAFSDPTVPEAALVMETYSRLQRDPDRDVRYFAASPLRDDRFASDPFEDDYHDLAQEDSDTQHSQDYAGRPDSSYTHHFGSPFDPSCVRHTTTVSSLLDDDDSQRDQSSMKRSTPAEQTGTPDETSQFSGFEDYEDSTC